MSTLLLDKLTHRYFIALLPPQDMQDFANEIKQDFAQNYNSRGAQNSPPHITLKPPFEWQLDDVPVLEQALQAFADIRMPVPVTLQGFDAFAPRVIYINVLKTPELLTLQTDLMAYCETSLGIVHPVSQTRPFVPHITVAFRDLTNQDFRIAWSKYHNQQVEYEFTASQLTLLIHDGNRWNVSTEFPFLAQS